MKKLILMMTVLMSTSVWASGSNLTETSEAIQEVLVEFQRSQTTEVVGKFNGVKAWPVSHGVKAKIYLTGNQSISYSCHRHEDNEPFECHEH